MTAKLLYTPVEAARALGISRSTVYVLLVRGDLRSVHIGASRRIPARALTDYVARLAEGSDKPDAGQPPPPRDSADPVAPPERSPRPASSRLSTDSGIHAKRCHHLDTLDDGADHLCPDPITEGKS